MDMTVTISLILIYGIFHLVHSKTCTKHKKENVGYQPTPVRKKFTGFPPRNP